jgi:hydrogenase-4 component B
MTLLLLALAIIVAGGAAALLLSRNPRVAYALGSLSAVAGCVLGLVSAFRVLTGDSIPSHRWPWRVPYGEFHLAVDHLSAFFLVVIFGLGLLAAICGGPYLKYYAKRKSLGPPWIFFNLLLVSMALVTVAQNGILFLVVWEVMALASYFLVNFDHEKAEARSAGWTYLIATHLGAACLMAMFALLAREAGSMDFADFSTLGVLGTASASAIFLLALAGFGSKAGFMPFHVWLPEAHPAAPSHVSAIMSGVMIKMGIYGILRTFTFLDAPPTWWGIVLICVGLSSGILGILFALAQNDLKRLLAHCSVENVGIITLRMGVGLWGISHGQEGITVLGFGGALFHVLNHAIFKSLLFFGAGSVIHATGQRDIDRLGGLLKSMPFTGAAFLIGAAAISGLPPLNGFISELLVFLGASGVSPAPLASPMLYW